MYTRNRGALVVAGLLLVLGGVGCDGKSDSRRGGAASGEAAGARTGEGEPSQATGEKPASATPAEGDELAGVHYRVFATAREALETILATKPRVIGFGEYHELTGSAKVQSTVRRFTEQLLDLMKQRAAHLIVETWVEAGKCGKKEERVSKDVRKVTQRPAHTQNELVRMIERAKKLGIRPHILELRCKDYEALLDDKNQVDYEKLLQMVTRKLQDQAVRALDHTKGDEMVALYGGSLHNDLYPYESVADFSYGKKVQEKSKGGYVEVDLYVPEYIEGDELLTKEDWFPIYRKHSSADHVLLIERGPSSYILVMKRALKPTDAGSGVRAPFDRSKLADDVERCVGHDGKLVKCVTRVRTGNRPKALAFSPDDKELWVALHYDKPAVAVYDTTTWALIGAVELGEYGAVELAFSADGSRVYFSQFETATVYEIDRAKRKVLRELKTGSKESKVVLISPDGRRLYVANWNGNDVSEFDLASGKLRRSLATNGIPRGLYETRDQKQLYVAGFDPARLYRFDLGTGERSILAEKGGRMRHIVAAEARKKLFISDLGGNRIWQFDLATEELSVLAETDDHPNTIDLGADERMLYVSNRGKNNPETFLAVGPEWGSVLVIDTQTGRVVDAIVAGNQSTGLDVSNDGRLLAVSDFMDNRINVYEIPATDALASADEVDLKKHRARLQKQGPWGNKAPKDPTLFEKLEK